MDKIFTSEEIERIKRVVGHLLVPINGRVELKPCLGDVRFTENGVVVRHQFYELTFESDKGGASFLVNYPNIPDIPMENYAWEMAAHVYHTLINSLGDKRDALEERLWPTENHYHPDYDGLANL